MKKTANQTLVLSKRMQAVADMVCGRRVADIGCDHAFVSIELVRTKKADKVIAADVRTGPLSIAESNIRAYGLSDVIETRHSDGFSAIARGEMDCAVIAGMGGLLMVRILEHAQEHLSDGITLVLQPQSEHDALRAYLAEHGYKILDEQMIFEDGKYYTIMKAVPSDGAPCDYMREELLYGPCLLANRHPVLRQYLTKQYENKQALYNKLSHIHTDKAAKRLSELEDEIAVLRGCLQRFK